MWDSIKVGQFIQMLDIEQNENLNMVEKQQKMLSIIENVPEEVYDYIKYRELVKLYAEKIAFFQTMPEAKPVDFIEVNGKRYKFCFELSEMTSGQYIDTNVLGSDLMQLHKIAACFFLPMEGDKYLDYGTIPHSVVADELLEAKFIEVYGCWLFFYLLYKELIKDIITSSEMKEEVKATLLRLWNVGDGYTAQNK